MKKDPVDMVATVLVVVGAINWGLFGALDMNLVALLFGTIPMLAKAVYVLVGLAGLYMIYAAFLKK